MQKQEHLDKHAKTKETSNRVTRYGGQVTGRLGYQDGSWKPVEAGHHKNHMRIKQKRERKENKSG